LVVVLLASSVLAQTPADDSTRAIGSTLKCPVCNGLSITESPSDFARSMLEEVRSQVKAGKSPTEIKAFFVGRYGESVLLSPPFSGLTLLVWLLPLAALGLGGWGLAGYLRRASQPKPPEPVDAALLERVRSLRDDSRGQA
jgi:cytochrome c-type biogenesis protein CcmH